MNNKEIYISVLMSVYKESEIYLRDAIESILNQTYKYFEFVIILDNPCNTSAEFIIKEYQKNDKRIILIKNDRNIGLTKSLNKGLKHCNGEYIARMDADDISIKDRLEHQIEYARVKNIDILGGNIQTINEVGEVICSKKNIPIQCSAIYNILRTTGCVMHPTWFVKKQVYVNLEGYRDIHTCEDYDFLLRAAMRNYKIENTSKVVVKYRINSCSISNTYLLKQYLSSTYLKKQYKKNIISNIKDVDNYLSRTLNEQEEIKYNIGTAIMSEAAQQLRAQHYIKYITGIIKSTAVSKYIRGNLVRILQYRTKSLWYKIKIYGVLRDDYYKNARWFRKSNV